MWLLKDLMFVLTFTQKTPSKTQHIIEIEICHLVDIFIQSKCPPGATQG